MYLRKTRQRTLKRASLLLVALVIFTPRLELPGTPDLMAFLPAVAQGQPQGT